MSVHVQILHDLNIFVLRNVLPEESAKCFKRHPWSNDLSVNIF